MDVAFDQQSMATLIVGASAKLDVLWQIFIALHFGVFTLLLLNRNKAQLLALGRVVALVGYTAMVAINYGALSGTYRILDGLQQQLRKDYGTPAERIVPDLRASFFDGDFKSRQTLLYATHGGALLLVVIIIFGAGALIRDAEDGPADD